LVFELIIEELLLGRFAWFAEGKLGIILSKSKGLCVDNVAAKIRD